MRALILTFLSTGVALAGLGGACGGSVTVDEPSDGSTSGIGAAGVAGSSSGAGGPGGAGASGTGAGAASGGGSSGCTSHDDCPGDQACLFPTGECVDTCDPSGFCEGCGVGTVCDGCGTSSCPGCKNCYPACVPIQAEQCDSNDSCPQGAACNWFLETCKPLCGPNGACPDGLGCVECATGSCCGCEDCVSLCLELDG